ncbi:hypothetical protein K493DRAFT_320179 [Basidiobolus meristosporus CBS 931.73]|uniref:C2H2-type domain-containing protein n=1 Tax=Basidiobolus meristosporus CBS 931.73 TaxID=1314790 RepID=A0A1Y1XE23_9FUNG|nr:hypothetical protein K493DRAFT_320179 [Basidiobolus meristosporus CBS 931.73]|eukprot:ORX83957.1 hypothetical protein K493DRAFT_320179 [Basidiobolus meristosporus CBS 931.73]
MVPAQDLNQPFCSDFTLFDDDNLAKNLYNMQQQQQLFNNLNMAKSEDFSQFYSNINSDFTLFDHDFEVPVNDPQKLSGLPVQPEAPQSVDSAFPPVKQTPQMTDIPAFTQSTENPDIVDFDFMSSFATPYTPYQSDFSGNNSLISPYTPCAPYTPVYPVLDFAPTPYIGDGQIDSSPAQSTPFLTPQIDFEQGNFASVPNLPQSNSMPKPSSFDMSLYCKDGSYHADDEPCDDRLPVLVAPLEEVTAYHQRSDDPTESNPSNDMPPSKKAKKDVSFTRPTAPNEKKYACEVCGLRFARKFNLNVHARGHNPTLARPFQCTQCPKAFGRKHDLSRHMATVHNGERPFSCDTCHKCFSRKDGLHRHLLKGCPGHGQ